MRIVMASAQGIYSVKYEDRRQQNLSAVELQLLVLYTTHEASLLGTK
jgi:hypothetical protein